MAMILWVVNPCRRIPRFVDVRADSDGLSVELIHDCCGSGHSWRRAWWRVAGVADCRAIQSYHVFPGYGNHCFPSDDLFVVATDPELITYIPRPVVERFEWPIPEAGAIKPSEPIGGTAFLDRLKYSPARRGPVSGNGCSDRCRGSHVRRSGATRHDQCDRCGNDSDGNEAPHIGDCVSCRTSRKAFTPRSVCRCGDSPDRPSTDRTPSAERGPIGSRAWPGD